MKILAITGPSGVGKGYFKESILEGYGNHFVQPRVITTRPRRNTDGVDRLNVSEQEFDALLANNLVFAHHRPYQNLPYYYGFLSEDFTGDKNLLTEIHPDNIEIFAARYGSDLNLIGLVASENYLRENLGNRGTESAENIDARIFQAEIEIAQVAEYSKLGIINEVAILSTEEDFGKLEISVEKSVYILKDGLKQYALDSALKVLSNEQ